MGREGASILIVDDEEPIRNLLLACLGDEFECAAAATAEEAIGGLKSGRFKLVISDLAMPGVSGLELCHFLRKQYPETALVGMTGWPEVNYEPEVMRLGAFSCLPKPCNLGHLGKLLRQLLLC